MARIATNGALIAIAATYGSGQDFSSISNANPAVASFASDPSLNVADIVEVTSGWPRLDGRIARIATTTGTGPYLTGLEGFNTSSTERYPAGEGIGSAREILTWTTIGQILGEGFSPSGGEQQYLEWQYISDDFQSRAPTFVTAPGLAFVLHDDIASAGQIAIEAAQESGVPYAIRFTLRGGRRLFGNAYWSQQPIPQLASNDFLKRTVTLSFVGGRLTQYTS